MIVIGVDPGTSPAVAAICDRHCPDYPRAARIPLADRGHLFDEDAFVRFVRKACPDRAVVELVGPMPGQGLSSTAHFMAAWGLIRGVLAGVGVAYSLVTPQVWKRGILPDMEVDDPADRKGAQKQAAVRFAQRHYPAVPLIRKGCRVPDHNLAEALCLAHWGMEQAHG